jgi:hypothetical protein
MNYLLSDLYPTTIIQGPPGATGPSGGPIGATGFQGATGIFDGSTVYGNITASNITLTDNLTINGTTYQNIPQMELAVYEWNSNFNTLYSNVDNNIKWNSEVINTDEFTYEIFNSGLINSRIYIKQSGIYEFDFKLNLSDLNAYTDSTNVYIKLMRSETNDGSFSIITLLANDKFFEKGTDGIIIGSCILNINNPGFYSVSILPINRDLYPSTVFYSSPRLTIKKIRR